MKHAQLDDRTHILRLDPGDDILATVQGFCADSDISNATIQGIGSVDSPTLAHYSIKTKQFSDQALAGIYEITALLGNVALVDGRPFVHLHATVSDQNMMVCGGHLVKGACSATLELVITAYPSRHTKAPEDAIGLKVWQFEG